MPGGKPLAEVEEPWQTENVFAPLDAVDQDGHERFQLLYLELPRGHAKTATLAMEALASAFLDGDVRIFMAAADQDQARLSHEALVGYLKRNPALRSSFKVLRNEIVVPATGASIRVLSSDAPSTFGLGGLSQRLLILADELWCWHGRDLWDALWSAAPKAKSWRVIVGSNAGFDTSSVAWELRELCRTKADERFYLYAPDGVQASWITDKDLDTQRRSLPPEVYQRLWENRWTEGSGSLVTREQLAACIDKEWWPQAAGQKFVSYFVGLDLGLVRDRTARAVVHKEPSGRVVLDDLRVWQGSRSKPVQIDEIERDLIEVSDRFGRPRIYCDPWQLAGSQQRLHGRVNIEAFQFTSESVRKLSENLLRLIRDAQLRLYPDAALQHELLALQMRETTYGWRLDHRSGGFSDRAMAIGMAALLATVSPSISPAAVENWRSLIAEMRSPGAAGSGFADVIGIPGLPEVGWRVH